MPVWYWPTAVQLVAVGHDTAFTWKPNPPAGTGMVWMDQELPSQCSASGNELLPGAVP